MCLGHLRFVFLHDCVFCCSVLTMDKFLTKKRQASKPASPTPSTSQETHTSNTSLPSTSGTVAPPPKKQKTKLSFNEKWLEASSFKNWLTKSADIHGVVVAKCKYCNIELANHRAVLEKHLASQRHLQLISVSNSNKKINLVSNPEANMVKRAELKLASMLAEHNLPFTLMDTLVPLMQNIFPDCNIAKGLAMGRTKATAVVTQVLGPEFSTKLINDLKEPGSYFSLIMDETTDTISQKQCANTVVLVLSNHSL